MKKFIGDRAFYLHVLTIAVPIMIQNAITNFVGLLDNLMVGQIGTAQMSGVAIVNQLIFVFNLSIFGIVSAASIFGTQFYGKRDFVGMRDAFRFKLVGNALMCIVAILALWYAQDYLISLYLHGDTEIQQLQLAHDSARDFLWIMLFTLPFFALSQSYASSLREMGKTIVPMFASSTAVIINTALNFLLIFGLFGFPKLGVVGAGIATLVARILECAITVIWVHAHATEHPFCLHVYRQFHIPWSLSKRILVKGSPLMANEILWAIGQTMILQAYSVRGLSVIASLNIASTVSNLFNIVYMALGSAVAVIIGQLLGSNKMQEARDAARKLLFFAVMSCFTIGIIMLIVAPLFPAVYQTEPEVKELASKFIQIAAICMPLYAFNHASYFILRSGGQTFITFLFDSVFVWTITFPLAYVLSMHTALSIVFVYFICQAVEWIKSYLGYRLIRSDAWMKNVTQTI
ncbi:MATE family efflux transporter [uncultured Enterococcus sp.]|uniref:MATE family efflux transporter n=1 Tax=uncultured Enterococcus sp. TaxID=167972 RepID=UPI0025D28121|nr:MATE family efflux transporter [uncultured Enterococcus sp.]